jgi:hypothetical protein
LDVTETIGGYNDDGAGDLGVLMAFSKEGVVKMVGASIFRFILLW